MVVNIEDIYKNLILYNAHKNGWDIYKYGDTYYLKKIKKNKYDKLNLEKLLKKIHVYPINIEKEMDKILKNE